MFEILKVLVEALSKAFSLTAVSDLRKNRKLADLGTELFLLYCGLNNVIVVANRIIEELEEASNWMAAKVAEGEPTREYETNLKFLLGQQAVAILQTVRSIQDLSTALQLIAPDVYRSIVPLLYGKLNAISQLLEAISSPDNYRYERRRHSYPRLVSASYQQLAEAMSSGDPNWFIRNAESASSRGLEQIPSLFESEPIDDLSSIPANKGGVIRAFLSDKNPKAVVLEAENFAAVLRDAIVKNFSTQDILLKVGDRRSAVTDLNNTMFLGRFF